MKHFLAMFSNGNQIEIGVAPSRFWSLAPKSTLFNQNRYTKLLNRILRQENRAQAIYLALLRHENQLSFCQFASDCHQEAIKNLKNLIIANRSIPLDDTSHDFSRLMADISRKMPPWLCEALMTKTCLVMEKNLKKRLYIALRIAPKQDHEVLLHLAKQQAEVLRRL